MRKWIAPMVALCVLPAVLRAEPPSHQRHKLRVGVTMATVTGGYTEATDFESFLRRGTEMTAADGGSSLGFRVGYEYRPLRRLGIAVDFESVTVDMNFTESYYVESLDFFTGEVIRADRARGTTDGELKMSPTTLGLHVYLSSGKRHDVYAGPVLGYVFYGSIDEDHWTGEFEDDAISDLNGPAMSIVLDDDTALGAVLGLDLDLGDGNASFHLEAGYLDASVKGKAPEAAFEMEVDPVMLRAGAVFRF